MQIPRRQRIVVAASIPILLLVGLILLNTAFNPDRAWAQVEAGLTSPEPGSTISGAVPIVGTAVSENFVRYELYYKPEPSGEDAYIYLFDGREQVIDGQLGVWQTGNLAPGIYSLRMRVVRIDGNYTEYFVTDLTVDDEEVAVEDDLTPTPIETPAVEPLTPEVTPALDDVDATATPIPTPEAVAATPTVTPTVTPIVTPTPTAVAVQPTPITPTVTVAVTPATTPVTPTTLTASVPATVTVVGGDEADLRAFLRAFLTTWIVGSPSPTVVTATVGTQPSVPFTLRLPPSVEVLGSVVRSGEFGGTQIFYAAPPPAANLVEVVNEQLIGQGFTVPPATEGTGTVFLATRPEPSILCNVDEELYAHVGMAALGDTMILQINLNEIQAMGGPCSPMPMDMGPRAVGVLPQLVPLEGTLVQQSGSGFGGDQISANARIEGPVTAAELAAHYEEQLEDAGWERLEDDAVDAIAWSAWSFADDDDNDWYGTFYIVQRAGDEESFIATLDAQRQR